uniref:Pentacotripeptide-repeat region of PRORP domain-containing protein n=1 Tax=Salix viminalis TaxID=40686 RepID=A0A6N2M3C3_SALVM
MEISKLSHKNLRYLSNPYYSLIFPLLSQQSQPQPFPNPPYPSSTSLCFCSFPSLSAFSSNWSPSVSKFMGFPGCNGRYNGHRSQILNLYLFKSSIHGCLRGYKTSSFDAYKEMGTGRIRPKAMQKQAANIIDLIKRDEYDLESKLDSLRVKLSIASVTLVFHVLNSEKVSALRFFRWIRHWQPELRCNSDICSLVIDNCGRLDDYDDMRSLLNEFNENRLCLTKKAFEFLHFMNVTNESLVESTQRVINLLREVRGSCYGSGVSSLMEMFSALGFFDMAKFVMKKTERKISHYYILIREMCRRCDFKGVRDIQDEMREEGFELSSRIYNYLISCLLKNGEYADACKVLTEMQEKDCPPDALTFEIFIFYCCNNGKIEIACHYFDEMVARDLEPRLSTHAVFIKGFFYSEQYEEAYKYVVDSDKKYKCSSCMNYSLLARLHQKRGNLVIAQNILSEMIKKGLRPYFKVYMKVLNCLDKSGRETLATDLQEQFHQLHSKA